MALPVIWTLDAALGNPTITNFSTHSLLDPLPFGSALLKTKYHDVYCTLNSNKMEAIVICQKQKIKNWIKSDKKLTCFVIYCF